MKLSKLSITFALVVSVHVAVLGFILLQPGCKSSNDPVIVGQTAAPTGSATGQLQPPSSTEPAATVVPEFQSPTRPTWTETAEVSETIVSQDGQAVIESSEIVTYMVLRGDNLSKIAKKHGVTVDALADANNMKKTDMLRLNQTLVVPSGKGVRATGGVVLEPAGSGAPTGETSVYVVQKGDSLSKIATKYRTSVGAIQRLNNLSGTAIRQGQKLTVPASGSAAAPVSSAKPAAGQGTYTIAAGDTLGSIATKNGVKLADLMAANPSVDSRRLQIGQVIVLPGAKTTSVSTVSAPVIEPSAPVAPTPTAPEAPSVPEIPVVPVTDAPEVPIVPVQSADSVPTVQTAPIEEL